MGKETLGAWIVGYTQRGRRIGEGQRGDEWARVLMGEYQVGGSVHTEQMRPCAVKSEKHTIQRYLWTSAGHQVQRAGTPPPSSPQTYNLSMTYVPGRGTQGRPSHLLTLEGHRVGKGAGEGVILEASLYGEAVFSSSFQEMYTAALWAGSVRNTNRSGWGCGLGQGRTELRGRAQGG